MTKGQLAKAVVTSVAGACTTDIVLPILYDKFDRDYVRKIPYEQKKTIKAATVVNVVGSTGLAMTAGYITSLFWDDMISAYGWLGKEMGKVILK